MQARTAWSGGSLRNCARRRVGVISGHCAHFPTSRTLLLEIDVLRKGELGLYYKFRIWHQDTVMNFSFARILALCFSCLDLSINPFQVTRSLVGRRNPRRFFRAASARVAIKNHPVQT